MGAVTSGVGRVSGLEGLALERRAPGSIELNQDHFRKTPAFRFRILKLGLETANLEQPLRLLSPPQEEDEDRGQAHLSYQHTCTDVANRLANYLGLCNAVVG